MTFSQMKRWVLILGVWLGSSGTLFASDKAHDLAGILLFDYIVPEFIHTSHSDPASYRCQNWAEFQALIADFENELDHSFDADTLQSLHTAMTSPVFLTYRQNFVRFMQEAHSVDPLTRKPDSHHQYQFHQKMAAHFVKIPIEQLHQVRVDLLSKKLREFESLVERICQTHGLGERIQTLYQDQDSLHA